MTKADESMQAGGQGKRYCDCDGGGYYCVDNTSVHCGSFKRTARRGDVCYCGHYKHCHEEVRAPAASLPAVVTISLALMVASVTFAKRAASAMTIVGRSSPRRFATKRTPIQPQKNSA